MFEIIINQVPKPKKHGKPNASNVWYRYLEDTLCRSEIIRGILEEEASNRIWREAQVKEYKHWKERFLPEVDESTYLPKYSKP